MSSSQLKTPPVKKREIFGWAMYDFANSSYTTVVITLFYAIYFTTYIVPETSTLKQTYWSVMIGISTLSALFLSPIVGTLCDLTARKKRYLFTTSLICSACTALLYFIKPGDVWPAMVLLIFSNIAFMLSESIISSFLPEISTPRNIGTISGIGWGIGYFGGLICVVVVGLLLLQPADALEACYKLKMLCESGNCAEFTNSCQEIQNQIPSSPGLASQKAHEMGMLFTGLFFFVAAIPSFIFLKKRATPKVDLTSKSFFSLIKESLKAIHSPAEIYRKFPEVGKFFTAFTVYMAGLGATIAFVGIYAKKVVGLTSGELTLLFIILQVTAAAGAMIFGLLEKKYGPVKTIKMTLTLWVVSIVLIAFVVPLAKWLGTTPNLLFIIIACLAGSCMGSTQSSSRALVGMLCTENNKAEIYGYWGSFSRIATLLGMSYGFLADIIEEKFPGNENLALLLVASFFFVGMILLKRVSIPRQS